MSDKNFSSFGDLETLIAEIVSKISGKVDKVSGKGLSTNDYTTADKNKVDALKSASTKDVPTSGNASSTQVVMGNDTRLTDSRNAKDVYSWAKAATKPSYTANEVGAIPTTQKGTASGVAELDANGKVPSSQLPSYVDDTIEGYLYNSKWYSDEQHTHEVSGESGKIYVELATNKTYRWSGSTFTEISESLALGETSSTAYRGDRGKTAYNHSQLTSGNPHGVTKTDVGLGNVPNVSTNNQTPTFSVASTRANIASGEKLSVIMGKIMKFFTDLKTVAFSGKYTDLTDRPGVISTTSNGKAITALTGTGTAGQDKGSGSTNRYVPTLWTFSESLTATDGEVYFIKIPETGGTYGVWLTIDGTNYHPVAVSSGKGRFTTHYAKNTVIGVTYESAGVCSCYAKTGADAVADVTGCFRVLDDYDVNTTYSNMSVAELLTGTATNARVSRSDYLKKGIIGLTGVAYGTCDTAAATAKKVVTVADTNWRIRIGAIVGIKFTNTNTANNPTFNVNNSGDKTVFSANGVVTTGRLNTAGAAGYIIYYMFDGTNWCFINWGTDNTTYTPQSLGFGYGTCTTAAATAAKVATLSYYALVTNGFVSIKFSNDVPASATLNINSKGAKAIYNRGAAIAAGVIKAGDIATFVYSGQYHLISIDRPIDVTPTTNSNNLVTSGGVKTELDKKAVIFQGTIEEWDALTTDQKKSYDKASIPDTIGLNRKEFSYVGMIIHSTTLDTESKVKQIYGGTTWIQHSGYVLRGATSGVVENSAVKTGGEDTHTLTVDEMPSHTHVQNSHNHTQNSHNHTQNAHNHSISGLNSYSNVASYYGNNKNGDWGSGNTLGSDGISIGNKTATNNATTATNNATTATNQNTGGGQAHNNLPSYKSVYIWERTA